MIGLPREVVAQEASAIFKANDLVIEAIRQGIERGYALRQPINLPPDQTDVQLVLEASLPCCPFCNGTPATFTRFFEHSGIYQSYVHCTRCMVQIFVNARDHEEARGQAIKAWRARAPLPVDPTVDDHRIIDLYQQGKTFDQIAEAVGLTKSAVHARLKKRGLTATRKRVKWTANMRNELVGLRAIKAPMSTIAKRLKVSRSAIYAELKRMGDSQPT